MVILRQPTDGTSPTQSSIKILADQFQYPISQYFRINLYSSNGTFLADMKTLSGAGGSSAYNYRTGSYTHSGLQAGTQYGYYCNIQYVSGGSVIRVPTSGYTYFSTQSAPVSNPPSTPSISLSSSNGLTVTLRASISSNTTSVEWDDTRWNGGSYDVVSVSNQTSTTRTWTVPNYNTTYAWDVIAKNSAGSSGWSSVFYWTSPSPPTPSTPTGTVGLNTSYGTGGRLVGGFNVSFGALSNATSYRVQAQNNDTGAISEFVFTSTSSSSNNVTGLNNGSTYNLRYRGETSAGTFGGWSSFSTASTLPQVPVLSVTTTSSTFLATIPSGTFSGGYTAFEVDRLSTSSSAILETRLINSPNDGATTFGTYAAGTSYRFRARTRWTIGSTTLYSAYTTVQTHTTETIITPVNPTSGVGLDTSYGVNGRIAEAFYVRFNALSGATIYEVDVYNDGTNAYVGRYPFSSTTGNLISGLQSGTTYRLSYRGRNQTYETASDWSATANATTVPAQPTITGSVTPTSMTITISSPPFGQYTDFVVERYTTTGSTAIDSKVILSGNNGATTWSGLPTGVSYRFRAYTRLTLNGSTLTSPSYSNWVNLTTDATRPLNWSWTTATDGNGAKLLTANYSMLASEWYSFQQRINEFRLYRGLTAYQFYTTDQSQSSFTIPTSGMDFKAYHMNQAINAINSLSTTGISSKSAGDDIRASDLNTLRTRINSIT